MIIGSRHEASLTVRDSTVENHRVMSVIFYVSAVGEQHYFYRSSCGGALVFYNTFAVFVAVSAYCAGRKFHFPFGPVYSSGRLLA